MSYKFNPHEITKEKSLWDIYKPSRYFKISSFNVIVLLVTTGLSTGYVNINNPDFLYIRIFNLSNFGFKFSISILGFLVAGFTIFSTVTKPSMLLKMMEINQKDTGLPFLKYNFFNIMLVFIYYLVISSIFLFIILFCNEEGIISKLLGKLPAGEVSKIYIIKIGYVFISCCIVFLLLQLKTFIFNIYAITMSESPPA